MQLSTSGSPSRSAAFDGLLGLASAALSASLAVDFLVDRGGVRAATAAALVVLGSAGVALRRRHPRVSVGAVLVATLGLVAIGVPMVVVHLSPLVVLYTCAALCPLRDSVTALVLSLAGVAAVQALSSGSQDVSTVFGNAAGLSGAWLFGTFVFSRQSYVRELETRTTELSAAREELAHAAVVEERLRLARELHDVVAHSLSMITLQAAVGAHVLDDNPQEARRSLEAVAAASKDALSEMRRMLGILRDEGSALTPAPGLDRLPALAADVSASGPQVAVVVVGVPRPLPATVDLAAYRIAQESLTNVVRHASATESKVLVTYEADGVAIEVVDNGRGGAVPASSGGRGLSGMEERVHLLGGTLDAGPLPDGGFRVRATLPVPVAP